VVLGAALGGLIAACGGDDFDINTSGGGVPAGFFIGETATNEDLSIAASSIRSIFFRCEGDVIFHVFSPPEPVAGDGSFAVEFEQDGQDFTVSGRFETDDRVEGSIAGESDCNGDFTATRCDPGDQDCGDDDGDTIPNEVDPDEGAATPTPAATPTVTGGGATATPTAAQATPTATGPEPTATATPTGLCGNGEIDDDEECDGANLDEFTCFDLCFDQEDEGGILTCNVNCTFNFSQCLGTDCEAF
jgi:hypothetical protein